MGITQKLLNIQEKLNAPKNQKNTFGNYNYRSCEDILEAVKPLCVAEKAAVLLNDEIMFVQGRFYVKATATLVDCESEEKIQTSAFAREADTKKGMDDSQLTGCASSYARKYALNGLFCIDDAKDSDTNEMRSQTQYGSRQQSQAKSYGQQQKQRQNGAQTQNTANHGTNRNQLLLNVVGKMRNDSGLAEKAQIMIEEIGKKSINDLNVEELQKLDSSL